MGWGGEGGGWVGHVKKWGSPKIKGKGGHVSDFTNVFSQSVLFRVHEGGNKHEVGDQGWW